MSGGSSNQPTQTTTTQISPEAQALFGLAYPSIANYAAAPPTPRYAGSTVAGFTPAQTAAQAAGVGAAGAQGDIANWATNLATGIPGALQWGGSAATTPYTPPSVPLKSVPTSSDVFGEANVYDPSLERAITAAQRPTWEALTQQALPAVRSGAIAQGPFGGSREQLAESRAVELANRQASDTAAQMAEASRQASLNAVGQRYGQNLDAWLRNYGIDTNTLLALGQQGLGARGQDITSATQQYGQNLDTLRSLLGLTPTLQGAQTAPAATLGAVGDVQQQMNQAQLNDAIQAYYYQQMAPYLKATDILGLVPSLPGATTVSTGNTPTGPSAMTALGGAATGAALGGTVFPGVGALPGAAVGATLPFLFR